MVLSEKRNNYNEGFLPTTEHQELPPPQQLSLNSSRQRFAIESASLEAANQFNNLRLRRTPPPNYSQLPTTPPPSYTSHHSAQEVEVPPYVAPQSPQQPQHEEQQLFVESRQLNGRNFEDLQLQQQQQLQCRVNEVERQQEAHTSNRNECRSAASAAAAVAIQRRQQQQRRRRLQLEYERIANINDSSSSTDSSSSESANSLDGIEFFNVRTRRRRHVRTRCLRDGYCPDLLNACSLILTSQEKQNDTCSTNSSSEDYSDYAEIDEIRPQRRTQNYDSLPNPHSAYARSTPELRYNVQSARTTKVATAARQCASAQYQNQRRLECAGVVEHQLPEEANNQRQNEATRREMGQTLSLRRPRISLTWVLREQQQQQPQQTQDQPNQDENPSTSMCNNNGGIHIKNDDSGNTATTTTTAAATTIQPLTLNALAETTTTTSTTTAKRRQKTKMLPGATDPLNGYATTPTVHPPSNGIASQKFFSNQNLLEYQEKRDPSKELLFVCTPQRLPSGAKTSGDCSDVLALAKRRNEIKKKFAAKMASTLHFNNNVNKRMADGAESSATMRCGAVNAQPKEELKSLKGTYSEPSLIAVSEGGANPRRHRHRKRRERNRVQKFGYEIRNVDEFLTKCSLASPGNIPVVLSTSSTLYQTRPGGYQVEVPLPLGMVVNAVFKNQQWLYVQTPHAEEGYVGYACCLPLGILPPAARGETTNGNGVCGNANAKPTPCWESNVDVFPRPCGNMTDSEKEIRLRGGTRSDGARTPRGKRNGATSVTTDLGDVGGIIAVGNYGEQRVDKLYLRAASQPKLAEKAYAQLRSTKAALATNRATTGGQPANTKATTTAKDEHQLQQQKSKLHVQKHLQQQQQQLRLKQQHHHQQLHYVKTPLITNGHNGQHLHPHNVVNLHCNGNGVVNLQQHKSSANLHQNALNVVKNLSQSHSLRQTLVAINADYATESISLQKGEIVTLCECRQSKDHRQWFYVRTRDGREGYIPAEVAGHGYL